MISTFVLSLDSVNLSSIHYVFLAILKLTIFLAKLAYFWLIFLL